MYDWGHHSSEIECPHVALTTDGERDEIFDVRLYFDGEMGDETNPAFIESKAALLQLIEWANKGIAFQAALEHLANPNHRINPTGADARDMAAYARAELDRLKEGAAV